MSNSGRRKARRGKGKNRAAPPPAASTVETAEALARAADAREASEPYVDPIAAALTATPEPTDVSALPPVEPAAPSFARAAVARVDASPPAPSASALDALDDTSVPPVGDLDVRDHESHFFDRGFFDERRVERLEWRDEPDLSFDLDFPDPHGWKLTASAARRRAELVKYVLGVVGVASALCVAALIRGAVPRSDGDLAAPASAHRPYVTQVDAELPAAKPFDALVPAEPVAARSGQATVDGPAAAAMDPATSVPSVASTDARLVRADAGASHVAPVAPVAPASTVR